MAEEKHSVIQRRQFYRCHATPIPTQHLHSHWRRSGVFIVNLEHISHVVLVFLL